MYLLQAANGEWHVIHGRKPIVQVIDDPRTPEPLIRELGEVRDARNFASRVLKLPDNDSYRTYVKIDRPVRRLERRGRTGALVCSRSSGASPSPVVWLTEDTSTRSAPGNSRRN